ncbi:hypothetical protein B6440_26315 [Salmonella enterica]|nr:hypothetical protein [Salmonella enterica]EAZ3130755.1 hypothetical protein [Salmonella enterica]
MTEEQFYREVELRADYLRACILQMDVSAWCRKTGNQEVLWQICRDTVAFMLPPSEGLSQEWRREAWAHLERAYPEALKQLVSLSGGNVLGRQAARGELHAGAVLHSLLKEWLKEYGGQERGGG